MKKFCLLIFLTFISFLGVSENACNRGFMSPLGEDEDWGIGACQIPIEVRIPIYSKSQKSFGYLLKDRWYINLYDSLDNEIKKLDLKEVAAISHISNAFVKVKKWQNEDYYLFDWKSELGGFLLKKDDLTAKKALFYNYQDLILRDEVSRQNSYNADGTPIGVNLKKSCLSLRNEPSVEGERIICIPGNDWESELKTRIRIK
jgi:hypothetical protein